MEEIYTEIEGMLKAAAKEEGLEVRNAVLGSTAKVPKKQLHLYGKKKVKILTRPEQQTYIVGVVLNKNFVGFYSMAVYAFPKEFSLSEKLKKTLKGKSCFQFKELDDNTRKELKEVISKSVLLFKKEEWV